MIWGSGEAVRKDLGRTAEWSCAVRGTWDEMTGLGRRSEGKGRKEKRPSGVEDESGYEEKRRKRRGVCCVSSGERGGERTVKRCLMNTNGLLVSGWGGACRSLPPGLGFTALFLQGRWDWAGSSWSHFSDVSWPRCAWRSASSCQVVVRVLTGVDSV